MQRSCRGLYLCQGQRWWQGWSAPPGTWWRWSWPIQVRDNRISLWYLTMFSASRRIYSVTVTASDGSGSARIPTVSSGTDQECCGTRYPTISTIPTPPFKRQVMGTLFYISLGAQFFIKVRIPEMREIIPEVRISDIHLVRQLGNQNCVLLSLIATGDDFTIGKAESHEIRFTSDRLEIRQLHLTQRIWQDGQVGGLNT